MRIVTVFTVFVFILCAFPVSAQINKNYSFSVGPQFGAFYGHAEEIVYPPPGAKAPLYSLLLWEMKPVFYSGLLMDFSPVRPMERWRFFSGLSMKFGIPGPSGVMEDKDWMSKENADLTHYSRHDNITKEIFLFDFSAGVSFPFFNALLVKTFVNISFMNFKFNGENGYITYARDLGDGKYAPIDDNPKEESFSGRGKVIGYRQQWFFAAPGVSVGYGYRNYFLAEIYFMVSPLVFCTGLDEHIERNIQFKDNLSGGCLLEPGFKFSFSAGKWIGISCNISWRYINGTRGPSYNRTPIGSGKYIQEGEAGSGLSILNASLLLKVKLSPL